MTIAGRLCRAGANRGHAILGAPAEQIVNVGVNGAVLVGDRGDFALDIVRERDLVTAADGIGIDLRDFQEAAGDPRGGSVLP